MNLNDFIKLLEALKNYGDGWREVKVWDSFSHKYVDVLITIDDEGFVALEPKRREEE